MHFLFTLSISVWIFFIYIQKVLATDVTSSSHIIDSSLGMNVALPVLTCHANHKGYHRVLWYKDYTLLRNGSDSLSDHLLPLSEMGEDPVSLQGYFWCETDEASIVHKYLFKIKEVNTYVGRFISTLDSLGEGQEMTLKEKLLHKVKTYENEMQNFLFGFLPTPNTRVTDIREKEGGLEVKFFVFSRQTLHPREKFAHELVQDRHELEDILEYLNNETDMVDAHLYKEIIDWTEFRGIHIRSIELRSTLGCYQEESLVPADPPKRVTWPNVYIGGVVIPDESCSTTDGLAVTRLCTGSFYAGARWGNPSGKCNAEPGILTSQIKKLHDSFGDEPIRTSIAKMVEVIEGQSLSVTDAHILLRILSRLSSSQRLQSEDILGIIFVIDGLVGMNKTELLSAKSTIQLTNRFIQIINNILKADQQREISVSGKHLLMESKSTRGSSGDVIGVSIELDDSSENASVEFLMNGTKGPMPDSLSYVLLPTDVIIERESELPFPFQVQVVFFEDWSLFPNPKGVLVKRNYKVLQSPVLMVSLSGGPAWNLSAPADLFFKNTHGVEVEVPVCVYFDVEESKWSSEGCAYVGLEYGFYHCRCYHLSIFSVVLSTDPKIETSIYRLGYSIYVGCSISIIALSLSILLHLLSKKWRQTVDQSILFHVSLCFLACLIVIFVSEIKFRWKSSCFFISLFLHYSLLAVFAWLLVHAVVHKLRFTKKTDLKEVPHFKLKASVCAYGSSGFIILIIWITRDYKYYNMDNCWSALADSSRAASIPICVLVLVTLCVNLCAFYAVTCRFRKDYLLEDSTYHESVIKFRIAFTIFFLFVISWIFGVFALYQRHKELRILFSISVIITSYYVSLFAIFQETSLWELCRKCRKSRDASSTGNEAVAFSAKPLSTT